MQLSGLVSLHPTFLFLFPSFLLLPSSPASSLASPPFLRLLELLLHYAPFNPRYSIIVRLPSFSLSLASVETRPSTCCFIHARSETLTNSMQP
ncbi:hypothetical protein V8C44DRAFT_341366 [Trichoderma aethiopicum]